ncbi:DUF2712 domain-containing protein [Heyndrickxia coagulans]|uniref:DUF2712 domain-containing protein n=1 Tax=Heyndrickxia coagulans TaxID=1398 RepID=UPI002E1E7D9C|nr:DUF2712 domain-containing protein [Heyndrickxia coagulans]MED4963160.1 DUF2712 domain-containing protein [Heyndrickxia coagulans]
MKNMKKIGRITVLGLLGIGLFSSAHLASASNDNVYFAFTIKPKYANSYSGERYRQTENPSNKWKVNFTSSGEGKGTVTTFWLDKKGTPVSSTHDVKQGSGAHYYNAISAANKSNVRLGAENNNYSTNGYPISGYWDEETD